MSPPAELADRAQLLRQLHRPGDPVILLNAWDVASARTFVDAGAPALATTSGGIAAVHGYPDGEQIPPELMLEHVGRIAAAVDVPVTADLESGYGLEAEELVGRILEAGAVGLNLEDSDHRGQQPLAPAEVHAERLASIRRAAQQAGVQLVLNARIDVFVRQVGSDEEQLADALRRAELYREAGADCVYPIMLVDEQAIARFVRETEAPVNIYLRPGAPSLERLASLGVARITVGTALHRAAQGWLRTAASALLAGRTDPLEMG